MTPITENHMGKDMEHEMEAGFSRIDADDCQS